MCRFYWILAPFLPIWPLYGALTIMYTQNKRRVQSIPRNAHLISIFFLAPMGEGDQKFTSFGMTPTSPPKKNQNIFFQKKF